MSGWKICFWTSPQRNRDAVVEQAFLPACSCFGQTGMSAPPKTKKGELFSSPFVITFF